MHSQLTFSSWKNSWFGILAAFWFLNNFRDHSTVFYHFFQLFIIPWIFFLEDFGSKILRHWIPDLAIPDPRSIPDPPTRNDKKKKGKQRHQRQAPDVFTFELHIASHQQLALLSLFLCNLHCITDRHISVAPVSGLPHLASPRIIKYRGIRCHVSFSWVMTVSITC